MEQAHALINDSGMKIFSIDDLQSAAERAVQLSKVVKMGKIGNPTPFQPLFSPVYSSKG
jgi:hypothetical protein